jgi:hypothetical protein
VLYDHREAVVLLIAAGARVDAPDAVRWPRRPTRTAFTACAAARAGPRRVTRAAAAPGGAAARWQRIAVGWGARVGRGLCRKRRNPNS